MTFFNEGNIPLSPAAKVKLEVGAVFISRIQDNISQIQNNTSYSRLTNLPKVVTVWTRGCRLEASDVAPMRMAAEIAIGEAAETVAAKYGKSRDQLIRELWPNTNTITVTMTYSPPNRFGFDLDLDEL